MKETLIRIRDRIKKGWCQEYAAIDYSGRSCLTSNPAAVSWCLVGAISLESSSPEIQNSAYNLLIQTLSNDGQVFCTLSSFNDTHGQTSEAVQALIDRAIATL